MTTKRIHLAKESGTRSLCRHTSRSSHKAVFVPLEQFLATPEELRCKECQEKMIARQAQKASIRPQRVKRWPAYGQIWSYLGTQVCILGNSIGDDGSIWAADWATGRRLDVFVDILVSLEITEADNFELVVSKCCEWAKAGNADAAWWLGWRFEGNNHPKSIWYYIAAIRMNPEGYAWAFDRVASNATFGAMCSGTPQPDNSFLLHIPEFQGEPIGSQWSTAIQEAERAIHQPATQSQLKLALQYAASGICVHAAAIQANVTEQFLTTSSEYRAFYEAKWATALNEQSRSTAATYDDTDEIPF